jgi:hypothetical protein
MLRSTEQIIDHGLGTHILQDTDLAYLFQGTAASRHALVNKAMKKGELVRLCRGRYILANKYLDHPPSSYSIANRLAPNSFVTAESALAFHGWIPERVTQVISICAFGRKRCFTNPLGEFVYYNTPVKSLCFYLGVEMHEQDNQLIYVASPLRALMDYVYLHKTDNANSEFLTHSLRIEPELVGTIQTGEIDTLVNVYQSKRVKQFLKNLLLERVNE